MILLEILFDNPALLTSFMDWLDGQGEQDFAQYDENGSCAQFEYDRNHKRIIAKDTCEE